MGFFNKINSVMNGINQDVYNFVSTRVNKIIISHSLKDKISCSYYCNKNKVELAVYRGIIRGIVNAFIVEYKTKSNFQTPKMDKTLDLLTDDILEKEFGWSDEHIKKAKEVNQSLENVDKGISHYTWGIVHISELPDSDAGVVPDTFAMRFSRV